MFIKLSNVKVVNANALSCPYTLGFSLHAIGGFIDNLAIKLNIDNQSIKSFVVVVNQVESKFKETISRDSAYAKKDKSKLSLPSMLPIKYFHFDIDIIIEIDDEETIKLIDLKNAVLSSKLQSGTIIDCNLEDYSTFFKTLNDALKHCEPVSKIIVNAYHEIENEENLDIAAAHKLQDSDYALMSNGYIYLKDINFKRLISNSEIEDDFEVDTKIVEPNLILIKYVSVYNYLNSEESNFCQFKAVDTDEYFIVTTN